MAAIFDAPAAAAEVVVGVSANDKEEMPGGPKQKRLGGILGILKHQLSYSHVAFITSIIELISPVYIFSGANHGRIIINNVMIAWCLGTWGEEVVKAGCAEMTNVGRA